MKRLLSGHAPADRRLRRGLIVVVVLALIAVGTATAVTSRATVAPSNNSLPSIGGSTTTGSTITANPGTWNGSTPTPFQYHWQICDGNGRAWHNNQRPPPQSKR